MTKKYSCFAILNAYAQWTCSIKYINELKRSKYQLRYARILTKITK